jgi:hypothetical protein
VNDVAAAFMPAVPVASLEGDDVPTPDGNAPAVASAEENPAGDASQIAHVAELEATLLTASSPGREAPLEPARRVN